MSTPKGHAKAAEAYLQYLYTPPAQAIIAKNYFRPTSPEFAAKEDLARFPKIDLITVDGVFGGWKKAQATHFADGGVFDHIQKARTIDLALPHARLRRLRRRACCPASG